MLRSRVVVTIFYIEMCYWITLLNRMEVRNIRMELKSTILGWRRERDRGKFRLQSCILILGWQRALACCSYILICSGFLVAK